MPVTPGNVITVVGEHLPGSELRRLANHPVPFHHHQFVGLVLPDQPLAATNAYPLLRLVFYVDKVDEGVRPVIGMIEAGHVDDVIDDHAQPLKFFERGGHRCPRLRSDRILPRTDLLAWCGLPPMVVHMRAPPVALTIAGSDCCCGAGLQADLKTFSAFGVHGLTAVTSVVAETPLAVHGIYPVSPEAVREQVRILLSAYPVAAVKTGMLGSARHVMAVAELLADCSIPLVVDPVMVASSGAALSRRGISLPQSACSPRHRHYSQSSRGTGADGERGGAQCAGAV